MQEIEDTDRDYDLWLLIAQVRHAMFQARQKELVKYNITGRQAAVMLITQNIGYKATPSEISRWLLREPHTVTDLLNRMEKKGLLTKTKDLDRKNMIRVALTERDVKPIVSHSKESPCII